MSLLDNNPIENAESGLQKMMDSFFNNELGQFFGSDFATNIPSVNVKETIGDFEIEVAAPGIEKDAFEINVEDGMLKISAENNNSSQESKERFVKREFNYSSFVRKFHIPEGVDVEGIKGSHSNGILSINMPKIRPKEEASKRRIEVK